MSTLQTNIIFTLPHKELFKLDPDVQPSPQDIRLLTKQVYACARSVPTALGGGANGHLGMVMSVANYAVLVPGNAFNMPAPPAQPTYAGDAAQVATTKQAFETQVAEYNNAHSLENQIKNMLQAAVPNIYLASLKDELHGLAMVSTREILAHLYTNYGTI